LSCATQAPPPAPAPTSAAPPAAPTPVPIPALRVAAPSASAPSGVLYRVGLKSDLTELIVGAPGTVWIVASGERAELVQGPVSLRGSSSSESGPAFQIQTGAFSQEEPARRLADRLAAATQTSAQVAFSADRGVYRVLLGGYGSRAEADAALEKLKAAGQDGFVVPGAPLPAARPAAITVSGGAGPSLLLSSPVDVFPPAPEARVPIDGTPYRGSLRILVNSRGTLNAVNRVDLEEYLYGVVPAEMGPKRFDALEALKAQAVAARTYALAHRGQFDGEGYDICATPKCQVYGGAAVEDPLTQAAVDGTKGLVLAYQGQFADALFVSTCGGVTENVENVFSGGPVPYLVSVECGELSTTELPGATIPRDAGTDGRSGLQWRGYVLRRHAPRKAAIRAASLATAQRLAGVARKGTPPSRLSPALVYPSVIDAFDLEAARKLHLTPRDEQYFTEPPSAVGRLAQTARAAYEFLLRFRFTAPEWLPPADRDLSEEEYAGVLFSASLRLAGVAEGSGRFLSREGSNLWVKTAEGRQGLPVDPEVPLARRVADRYYPTSSLTLRAGDRVRWWKSESGRVLAFWVELDPDGPTFERESSWTEWVRRVPAKELARRMSGRVAGTEVREITVTQRSPAGRAIEMRVRTDAAEATFKRFDLRQAVEMPEMLFTVSRVAGPEGETEFLFLGRGWGHGVGLCQNGAFGMALAGETYGRILKHYYTGVEIVPASTVAAGAPSTR
ncbi:MAG: SpoIID/LytB domain-containing protein, partial [Acidobacteriota bacterium]